MNQPQPVEQNSIAHQAELETWQDIRNETRRQLAKALTIGILYLLAALAVGAYLILSLAAIGRNIQYLRSWELQEVNASWVPQLAWIYAGIAVIAMAVYVTAMMLIADRLPASMPPIVGAMPWIGSTMRIVSIGEFCQSIYESVLRSQPYGAAFSQAGDNIGNPSLRRWAIQSSQRIDSGRSLGNVLQSSPIRDHPLSAAAALTARGLSQQQSAQVWHRATAECHLLAQSRLERTTLAISTTCLLASVLIASLAMLLSVLFLGMVLKGLTY